MVRRRTKKEARERIDSIDLFGTDSSGLSPRLDRLLEQANVIEEAAKAGAKILIELDPLNRLSDSAGSRVRSTARAVTDDTVAVPIAQLAAMINDPDIAMESNGDIVRKTKRATRTGREVIRRSGQFDLQNLLPPLPKRTRKKNGNDKKLSAAFKEANKRLRTKSGKLRKGKTQADIARLAQRLRKKM